MSVSYDDEFGYHGLVRFRKKIQEDNQIHRARTTRETARAYDAMPPTADDFSDLTIGVTAFNRPRYLVPLLGYIADYFPGATIIIGDASDAVNKERHKAKIGEMRTTNPGLAIIYDEHEPDTPWLDVILRISNAITTEYFVKWDDDDFYNPAAIREAIGFMESDPSISCMTGPSVNLAVDEDDRLTITGHVAMTFEDEDLIKRLVFVGLTATQVWNHLFRTSVFREAIPLIMYLRTTRLDQLWDHAMTIETALRGVCRKTPGLFMARRIGPQRLSQNVYSRGRDMIYKLIDPEQSADYAKFRDNVANTLERHLSAYGPDKPKFALDEVCKCLFIASCGNELLYRALHREFVVTHPQTEAWLSLLKTDEQASMFVSTAMSIVAETD